MVKRIGVMVATVLVMTSALPAVASGRYDTSAKIEAEYAALCDLARADAEQLRSKPRALRPMEQETLHELEHIIATRCEPRGY